MSDPLRIALKSGESAELFAGEAEGFRVIVWRLKSLAGERTIPPAETRRATVKGVETVARPRYQKGSIFFRGRVWVLRYREDVITADEGLDRIHRSVVLGSFSKKKEAQRAAEGHLRQMNSGALQPQAAMTMKEFWERFFVPEALPTLKPSTRKLYTCLAQKHLLPCFGASKLCDIRRVQVQHFVIEKQREGYAVQTLGHLRNLLSKIFGTAISWGWLLDNQARGVKLPPMERRRFARVLSPSEIGQLSKALSEPARSMFLFALGTGLRIGEVLGLQVSDLDLQGGSLFVRRTIYRGEVGTPKTKGSERRLPLSLPMLSLVKSYLGSRKVKSDWLFCSEAGTPLDDRNLIRREIEPISDDLKIPRFSWHSLRHTFSTFAGNNGVAVPFLQFLLGHTTSETTMLYTHPLEIEKRTAVKRIARVLFPNVPALRTLARKSKALVQ